MIKMHNLLDFTTRGNGVSKNQTKLKNSTGYFVSIMVVISITFSLVISLPIYITVPTLASVTPVAEPSVQDVAPFYQFYKLYVLIV